MSRNEHYWEIAQIAGGISGANPDIIYCQFYHETAGFTSELCTEYHNLAGVTQIFPNDLGQPDGTLWYKKFESDDDFARYFGKFIRLFDGATEATNIEEYATALKNEGYFGDTLENYINGMTGAYNEAFAT